MNTPETPPENQSFDPAQLLAYRVLGFSQRLYRGIEIVLKRELDLSVRQWRILLFLANYGPHSSQKIAEFWRYDKSQVSRAVAELIDKGLIESQRYNLDARRNVIKLTAAGCEMYERGLPLSLARQKELTSCLSPEQITEFERTLDMLTIQADEMLGPQKNIK